MKEKTQSDIIKTFSPEKKLLLSLDLYYHAWELKKAAIKKKYPELSEEEIRIKVRDIFMYART
mgnify:CR=1 FL=1